MTYTYTPKPIDTSGVSVPDHLTVMVETLARNSHDHWAQKRIAEGWTFGNQRDDTAKTNPTLIPYEMLPDSEKQYDRDSAMETIRTLLKMGYSISKF